MVSRLTLPFARLLFFIFTLSTFNGCSYIISSATDNLAKNLQQAILDANDPALVQSAIPAYLLLQESFIVNSPDNAKTLLSTSQLYAAYATLLSEQESNRKIILSNKALNYSMQAICIQNNQLCDLNSLPFAEFEQRLTHVDEDSIPSLYITAKAWAGWIQANKSDWNAIAQLAQVKRIIQVVVEYDEHLNKGEPLLYKAVLESLLPPALGGNPARAQQYFEKALTASERKNLMVHVMYAKQYARMMFDQELHDMLLNEAINADPAVPGLTLTNSLAQQQARELLDSSQDYF